MCIGKGLCGVFDSNVLSIQYGGRITSFGTFKFQFLFSRQYLSKSLIESTEILAFSPELIDFGYVSMKGKLSPQINPILIPVSTVEGPSEQKVRWIQSRIEIDTA